MKKNNRNYNVNNGNGSNNSNNSNQGNTSQRNSNDYRDKVTEDLQSDLNKFGNMSQSQLMQELLSVARDEKRKGNLTPEVLDTFYQTINPSMNDEQRRKMNSLINELKK